jgi:peptide/nickel transport system ATP-binding protein
VTDLLVAEDLRAYYRYGAKGWIRAVDGVSLTLREGEILGVAGESGCGKSTLAAVLASIARWPLCVRGGRLRVDGRDIPLRKGDAQTTEHKGTLVSLMPQGAMNSLNPTQRVRDFVFDVLRSHDPGVTRRDAVERARQRLEKLALPARVLDAYPHQLSGGMKQRVVAVISTLLDPRVLIADEPTSALDVSAQRALLALMASLLEQGIIGGIVLVTHELPVLRNVAHRTMIMYAGQVSETGPTERVIFAPAHPYTQALMKATVVLESATKRQRIEGLEGAPPDLSDPPAGCRFHPRCAVALDACREAFPGEVSPGPEHTAACWWLERQLGVAPAGRAAGAAAPPAPAEADADAGVEP